MSRATANEVTRRLGTIARRQWTIDLVIRLLRTVVALLLLSLAGTMLLGTAETLSSPLSVVIAIAVWLGAGLLLVSAIRAACDRPTLVSVARQIERLRPDLEERLSSAIELCREKSFTGSAALRSQLVAQAESCAAQLEPRRLVSTKPAIPWAFWTIATLLIWVIVSLSAPMHGTLGRGLSRLITPWQQAKVRQDLPVAMPPEITSLSIHYEYPPYTALPARTVSSSDGTVDAVVGTRIRIVLQTSHPLSLASSALMIGGLPSIPLQSSSEGEDAYAAGFTLRTDSSYTIRLTDAGRSLSRLEPPRIIHARPDQVPSIVVQSPQPQVSVRPDDIVPIQFLAADDFGVARIDLITRADDGEPQVVPVPFEKSDPRHITGPSFALAVDDILAREKKPSAREISYQLRVVDNREPNPQRSASPPQILKIDENQARSYAGQEEQQVAGRLRDLIQNVLADLDRSLARIGRAKTRDVSEPLGEWQRKELHQAAVDLTAMTKGLSRAGDQASDSVFARVSNQMKLAADGPLRKAAEEASRADAEADDWQQRNDAIAQSAAAIASARLSLQRLADGQEIERLRGMSEAARDLASAGKLERTGRTALARKRLAQAFREAPALRRQDLPVSQMREAAQAAQTAEGLLQNGASEQAAGQLQLAASALAQALSSASTPNASGSQAQRQVAATPLPTPSRSGPISGPVPAAVRDLGLSAEDWARLPPLEQRELLNASQQNPPAEYREMVRDYFVKLARMHKSDSRLP